MQKPFMTALAITSFLAVGCSGLSQNVPPASTVTPLVTSNPTPNPTPVPDPTPEPPKPVPRVMPMPVRGLMVSGWYAGRPDLSGPLLTWAKGAGLNTIVLDIKAEDGKISWESDVPLAKEIDANVKKVPDIEKFIKEAKEIGFWVAGRIVVMNDASLYKARPAWGIPGFPGGAYSFMDPKNENVWRYNLDIAHAAVKAGVDEIQFDYIRYSEKLVNGYNKNTTAEFRTGHIIGFLKKAMEELRPKGVVVGADLFGLTTSVAEGDDMQIGQDYKQMAQVLDYVAAMAYPSHYALGTYGLDDPNKQPYETIKNSLGKALERSQGIPMEKHRPWIQDFTMNKVPYGVNEVKAQVKALEDLGIKQFMLWDPSNKYTRGIDYSKPM